MADAIEFIEQQEWLAPAEEGLQDALKKVFPTDGQGTRSVENFLHGTWMGHPLHPAITDVPVGAFTTAVVFDLAGMEQAADTAVAIGLVGSIGAAVTGLTDWKDTRQKDRRIGLVHGILNTISLGLYVGSLIARRKGDRVTGRALGYAGFGVLAASAWVGAEMVYKYRTGVDRSYEIKPPSDWTPVLPEAELFPNQPKKVEAAGFPVFLLKKGDKIYAMGNTCSHRGGPLNEGRLDGDCITCPWHGSTFNIETGDVVNGPATQPQPRFDLRVQDGQIEVKVLD